MGSASSGTQSSHSLVRSLSEQETVPPCEQQTQGPGLWAQPTERLHAHYPTGSWQLAVIAICHCSAHAQNSQAAASSTPGSMLLVKIPAQACSQLTALHSPSKLKSWQAHPPTASTLRTARSTGTWTPGTPSRTRNSSPLRPLGTFSSSCCSHTPRLRSAHPAIPCSSECLVSLNPHQACTAASGRLTSLA